MSNSMTPQTIAAANGIAADPAFAAVVPPIHLSTTFAFAGFEQPRTYEYGRAGNPSRDLLGQTIAKLEGGAGAIVVASGMAAVDLVLSRLRPGDLVVAPHDCYGGTYRLLAARRDRGHFDLLFVDQGDGAALSAALDRKPALVLIETPSNPLMRVVDIRAIASRAKAVGAKTAVDNTFLSPALQQPIALGADFVIHSTTKYLNGHSDIVGGAVIAAEAEDAATLAAWANITGVTGSPFDAYQTLRGIRTLFPRVESQQRNAGPGPACLASQPQVKASHDRGRPSQAGNETARKQQRGFSAMLSFELTGGTGEGRRFVNSVRIFTLAEALSGME